MAGLIFRWDDLEILDDPIPDKLYCQHFRAKNRKREEGLVEDEVKIEPDIDSKPGGEGNGGLNNNVQGCI